MLLLTLVPGLVDVGGHRLELELVDTAEEAATAAAAAAAAAAEAAADEAEAAAEAAAKREKGGSARGVPQRDTSCVDCGLGDSGGRSLLLFALLVLLEPYDRWMAGGAGGCNSCCCPL